MFYDRVDSMTWEFFNILRVRVDGSWGQAALIFIQKKYILRKIITELLSVFSFLFSDQHYYGSYLRWAVQQLFPFLVLSWCLDHWSVTLTRQIFIFSRWFKATRPSAEGWNLLTMLLRTLLLSNHSLKSMKLRWIALRLW